MVKRTGPSNMELVKLIALLKKQSNEQGVKLWKRIASDLEKPTRNRREVNLFRIDRHTKENEMIIVPGKVLGTGDLGHKLTVAAFNFSESALNKIKEAKGECITIEEMMQKNPKAQKLRIIG